MNSALSPDFSASGTQILLKIILFPVGEGGRSDLVPTVDLETLLGIYYVLTLTLSFLKISALVHLKKSKFGNWA